MRIALSVCAVALLSAGAAHVLAQRIEQDRAALASLIRRGLGAVTPDDPDSVRTGSVMRRAERIRFDPCAKD
jgi:hypothetical protein